MKLKKILKVIDTCGLCCVCWIKGDTDPIYKGSMFDLPYWIADLPLDLGTDEEKEEPEAIDFRDDLGEECHHRPGFVICLKDKGE